VFILAPDDGRSRRPLAIWEIHLTQIAAATGDENLAGDGAAHWHDRSRGVTSGRGFG